jgi:hypothetical protein
MARDVGVMALHSANIVIGSSLFNPTGITFHEDTLS